MIEIHCKKTRVESFYMFLIFFLSKIIKLAMIIIIKYIIHTVIENGIVNP